MFRLSELIEFLKEKQLLIGEVEIKEDKEINRFASLLHPSADALCWSQKTLPIDAIPNSAVLLCRPEQEHNHNLDTVMIHVQDPRRVFGTAAYHFNLRNKKVGISDKAQISATAVIGKDVYIGPYTVIEDGCRIGDGTTIDSNVTIYHDVTIGKNCHIWAGAVIGADGHGYFLDDDNYWQHVVHMGNVVIGDNVEIKANSCVDRGVLDDTTIGDNTKIDNLVQVAHNVVIGRNTFIAGGTQIGGSCVIGDNCWLGSSCVIKNGAKVANEVRVCINSVVVRDIKRSNATVYGDPAKYLFSYNIGQESKL